MRTSYLNISTGTKIPCLGPVGNVLDRPDPALALLGTQWPMKLSNFHYVSADTALQIGAYRKPVFWIRNILTDSDPNPNPFFNERSYLIEFRIKNILF